MPSVAVVGSVNLDLVASCSRLPLPGETVSANGFDRFPGGKGANQALAAHRAGASVSLIGAVGNDAEAELALEILTGEEVNLSGLVTKPEPTGLALISVDSDGENQIVVVPGANGVVDPDDIDTAEYDAVLCQLEIPMEAVEAAAMTATGLFVLNPAPARRVPSSLLNRCDVIVVNETEREALAEDIVDTGALIVVTLGQRGATAMRKGKEVARAPSPSVHAVDTVGAGDAFCGYLTVALAQGTPVGSALEIACAAGALATTKHGAQPSLPTRADVERILTS